MKIIYLNFTFVFLNSFIESLILENKFQSKLNTWCYGTNLCNKNTPTQNHILPNQLSKMTCFDTDSLNFTMGTNKPIFKSDGESPARTVFLSPFCMDQTQVSNLQFYQFVKETKYTTEVFII